MVDKLQNLIEDVVLQIVGGATVKGITEYTVQRARGSIGQTFTMVIPKVIIDGLMGDQVVFKGINGILTSKEIRSTPDGFETTINGTSRIGELIRRAPVKTLMYQSMTQEEKDEFNIACGGDYSNLDYIPLIRICDPITFTGGWTVLDVINDLLIVRAGFNIVCNVYNFWIRQVQASNQSPYYDSAIGLVSFLKPIIYELDDVIYVLERPLSGGSVQVGKMVEVDQRYVYNFESKAQFFQVSGGYGKWAQNKSKIKAVPESETELVSETYQEKPQLCTVNIRGEKPVVDKMTGGTTYEWGGIGSGKVVASYSFWLKEPMRERYTTTEVWRLDPFGNFKALMSRRTVGYNMTLAATVLDALEEYTYDFLTEEYERPRLTTKKKTEGRYTWLITQGIVSYRAFAGKVVETSESWAYATNGLLLQEMLTTSMDVVRLSAGDEYSALDVADKMYRTEGSADTVNVERMVVEEKVIKYRQITPDLYQRAITIRKLGPLARKVGQENYISTTEIVRGQVPRQPRKYRTMLVYCDNVPEEEGNSEVPVITVNNPNIIDWTDACAILARIQQLAAESNVTERTFKVPGDIPVDVGWTMVLPSLPIGAIRENIGGNYPSVPQSIPDVVPSNYALIVAYTKTKSAGVPSLDTVITVEAK